LIGDLKEQLQQAEHASEEYKKQIEVLQSRLDDAVQEQGKLEDKLHEEEERVEGLENDKREGIRQRRELESIYEAERAAAMKEREATQAREEEFQSILQRMRDSLSQKVSRPGPDEGRISRTGRLHSGLYLMIFANVMHSLLADSRNRLCTSIVAAAK
jgi:septal ring factor EnvC (AmiA/AmiB activator)